MDTNYKAERYRSVIHHAAETGPDPWDEVPAYDTTEYRYRIISSETGEVLDDAQGYGYKTAQKAYAAYAYKHRDKSKDKIRQAKKKHIEQWLREHKALWSLMDDYAFQIAKGAMEPDAKFDAECVKELLKENDLNPDFSAGELLKVWESTKV